MIQYTVSGIKWLVSSVAVIGGKSVCSVGTSAFSNQTIILYATCTPPPTRRSPKNTIPLVMLIMPYGNVQPTGIADHSAQPSSPRPRPPLPKLSGKRLRVDEVKDKSERLRVTSMDKDRYSRSTMSKFSNTGINLVMLKA